MYSGLLSGHRLLFFRSEVDTVRAEKPFWLVLWLCALLSLQWITCHVHTAPVSPRTEGRCHSQTLYEVKSTPFGAKEFSHSRHLWHTSLSRGVFVSVSRSHLYQNHTCEKEVQLPFTKRHFVISREGNSPFRTSAFLQSVLRWPGVSFSRRRTVSRYIEHLFNTGCVRQQGQLNTRFSHTL